MLAHTPQHAVRQRRRDPRDDGTGGSEVGEARLPLDIVGTAAGKLRGLEFVIDGADAKEKPAHLKRTDAGA
jgi:hypothetical protein